MHPARNERRQFQRISLTTPAACFLGELRGFVFDVSVNGAMLFCAGRIEGLEVGARRPLRFEWESQLLSFECEIVHTGTEFRETRTGKKLVTRIGCRFSGEIDDAYRILREIIAARVERALDEQKANARGIPAMMPFSVQRGARDLGYIQCRLRGTTWIHEQTRDPAQPRDGFTVGADESEEQISLLCKSYQESDFEGRRFIRSMAELSVSRTAGVPTRKYDP